MSLRIDAVVVVVSIAEAALPPPLTEELIPLGYRRLFPYKLAVCGLYLTVYWKGVDGRRALWQAIRLEFAAAVEERADDARWQDVSAKHVTLHASIQSLAFVPRRTLARPSFIGWTSRR